MIKLSFRLLKSLLFISLILFAAISLFVNFAPAFGDKPRGESIAKISQSKHFDGEKFVNLIPTQLNTSSPDRDSSISTYFFPPEGKNPGAPLPSEHFDKNNLVDGSFVWFGHSTILMQTAGIRVLADPVFYRASPVAGIGKAFPVTHPIGIGELPDINVVIISHDHYDHLDHLAIQELDAKTEMFFVPLGVKAHLLSWGIDAEKIIEKDWYQAESYQNVQFTFTPARHFSGRGIFNRNSTLWGAWVIKSDTTNVYFGGDSGYFEKFKNIGKEYGPFDIAFLENGAYDLDWAQIHMMPEETVQASQDLQAKLLFPIHWAKFDLAQHNWDEPALRVHRAALQNNVALVTPLIGQIFTLETVHSSTWWKGVK